jgi:type IV pilus assembly protein PilA
MSGLPVALHSALPRYGTHTLKGDFMRNKQKGFSLIELLIVVAIILIIAAIAIPNLLRSKMAANEASAVGSLRTLNTASVTFSTSYGSYPGTLSVLGPVTAGTNASSTLADLIDSVLASGTKSGYSFTWSTGSTDNNGNYLNYSITAGPTSLGTTGQRYFYTDQSGVIRANVSAAATVTSTPLS